MTDVSPPPARPRAWVRIVMILSLALNLLVIVAVVSFVLSHGGRDGRHRPPRVDRMGGPLTHALSPEDRRDIGREIGRSYREGRPSRADVRAEYEEVIAALRAEPYDPATVERSLEKQLDFAVERQRVGQQALRDRLAEMSVEERRAFADRLEEGLNRRRD